MYIIIYLLPCLSFLPFPKFGKKNCKYFEHNYVEN